MRALLWLLLAAAPAGAWAASEEAWPKTETAHFTILQDKTGASLGEHNKLERIYDELQRELWALVPWMADERIKVYLYNDRDAYLAGMFAPAPWSGGLARVSAKEKSLALYEPLETATAAHELAHLYLHAYFAGGKRPPPPWLDEGLAGLLQDTALSVPDSRDKGPLIPSPLPLKDLVSSRPARDDSEGRVGLWYRQAQSLVLFLKRSLPETKFVSLCAKLKEGEALEKALRSAYDYEDLAALEAAWLKWRPKKAPGLPSGLEDL